MNRAPSTNPPFGLRPNEVKQLASFTFDDNAYSGLPGSGGEGGIKFILDLFNENRNHDGSPIVGTFFLKADNITDNDTEENCYVITLVQESIEMRRMMEQMYNAPLVQQPGPEYFAQLKTDGPPTTF